MPDLDMTKLKGLHCHNCDTRIYWSLARDRWEHSMTEQRGCGLGSDEVAHPRLLP